MRELKFRAWDKTTNRMVDCQQGPHNSLYFDKDGASYYNLQNGSGGDEYVLMQLTGLHDKNGREIYEGDILKHVDGNYGYGGDYDKTHDGYLYTPVPWIQGMIGDGDWDPDFVQHYEVIGNIHENPELLEVQP